MLYAKGKL